jgi:hypothetical protein
MMALPQPVPDDAALVAAILRDVPDADDEVAVRGLLEAWWRYAGLRATAGAVVDSERFVAERSSLGMLELPPAVALQVIEREFALLHARSGARPAPTAPAQRLQAVPEADPWPDTPALETPIPLGAGAQRTRRVAADAERIVVRVVAGGILFFAIVIGLAIAAALGVPHVPLPTAAPHALVPPWRAWLAILTGLGGLAGAEVALRLRRVPAGALAGPRVGLAGLAVAGLGLLAGSVPVLVAGLVALVGGAARGTRKRP